MILQVTIMSCLYYKTSSNLEYDEDDDDEHVEEARGDIKMTSGSRQNLSQG